MRCTDANVGAPSAARGAVSSPAATVMSTVHVAAVHTPQAVLRHGPFGEADVEKLSCTESGVSFELHICRHVVDISVLSF